MSDPVQLSVRSSLGKIIEEMEALKKKTEEVRDGFDKMGDDIGENLKNNAKKTENYLDKVRSLGRRVADQLRGDFKSLVGINALSDSLKLSNQFKGSIAETIGLSDAIRKLGGTFGIASKDFISFQSNMIKGLGNIGLSSEVASRTLQGLADTPVRGEKSLVGYSQSSGMLASVSREQGKEGDIAKGIARVIQARGGNVNNMGQVKSLSEDLRRVFNVTGKGPTETLKVMEDLFAKMPKDLRQSISSSGLTNLAAASSVGGPNATKFLEEYLGKSPIARMAFDAQGGKGIFNDKGIDAGKFQQFAKSIMGRVGGDSRMAAQTLGLSDEAAEGFVRLAENLDKVTDAQNKISASTGDLTTQYKNSMGFAEAFKANINKVKSLLATPLSWLTQKGTAAMSGASDSNMGAGAVVAGGGLLAALLAGAGTRMLGKGLLGSVAKGAVAEGVTGKEVQPVYVVNASEIGGVGSTATSALGSLKGAAKFAGVAGLAYAGGALVSKGLESANMSERTGYGAQTELKWIDKNMGEGAGDLYMQMSNLMQNLNNKMFGTNYEANVKRDKVIVELNKRDLKESKQPTRGSSY